MAKKGYYGGDVAKILSLPVDMFYDIVFYENQLNEVESIMHRYAREDSKK